MIFKSGVGTVNIIINKYSNNPAIKYTCGVICSNL